MRGHPFRAFIARYYDPDALIGPFRRALIALDPTVDGRALGGEPFPGLDHVSLLPMGHDPGSIQDLVDADQAYTLVASSLLSPLNLAPGAGDTVLDACAAPGGKALLLRARAAGVHVIANERSRPRRARMARLFEQVAPELRVTGLDAADLRRLPPPPPRFILLDAPCSSDEHLVRQDVTEAWSERRSRNLASRQKGLLMSCFRALAPGGRLVYATCTGSPYEGEWVIARFLARVGAEARLVTAESRGLPTRRGVEQLNGRDLGHVARHVLRARPDEGMAPAFVAVVEKES
jgi:16S rRNA C967 or C1407 C5-methylase (RsmB/RsmF family)